jgi:hypothetical protein
MNRGTGRGFFLDAEAAYNASALLAATILETSLKVISPTYASAIDSIGLIMFKKQ